jgi:hypothetical protein
VREFRSSCFRRRSRHDVVDVESRFLTCLEQGRNTRNDSLLARAPPGRTQRFQLDLKPTLS